MVLQFRQVALDDLSDIWDYSILKWGKSQTTLYVRNIHEVCLELSKNIRVGMSAETIRPNYSKYLIGQHLIFYKKTDDHLVVHRILHQNMDVSRRVLDT